MIFELIKEIFAEIDFESGATLELVTENHFSRGIVGHDTGIKSYGGQPVCVGDLVTYYVNDLKKEGMAINNGYLIKDSLEKPKFVIYGTNVSAEYAAQVVGSHDQWRPGMTYKDLRAQVVKS